MNELELHKLYFLTLFDLKGRLCSPKLCPAFISRDNPSSYLFLVEKKSQGFSFSETIYCVINDISSRPKCEFCDERVNYSSFKVGYEKTCKSVNCLKMGYGKNPHIPTEGERSRSSKRMKENNPMFKESVKKQAQKQAQKTQKEKYGCLACHLIDSREKALNSRYDKYNSFSPRSNLFRSKEYLMPSGEKVFVQGYEHFALDILLTRHEESDIVLCGRKHAFRYEFDGKEKIYYTDIFIPSKNLYIEVKSDYTYSLTLKQNLAKRKAIISAGHNFEFWILNKKGELQIK